MAVASALRTLPCSSAKPVGVCDGSGHGVCYCEGREGEKVQDAWTVILRCLSRNKFVPVSLERLDGRVESIITSECDV